MPDFRTPRSKVIGLGAAHSGVGHFIGQRVSAIALFFLLPVFLAALALNSGSLSEARAFVANPLGAILTLAKSTIGLAKKCALAPPVVQGCHMEIGTGIRS